MKSKIVCIFLSLIFAGCASQNYVTRMSATFENSPVTFASEFYNNGSGFDLLGEPIGDSITAFNESGGSPSGEFSPSIVNNRQSAREVNGTRDVVCHRAEENNNNYAVWKPVEVLFNPVKTNFLTTISVDPNMIVRFIFSNNTRPNFSGFTPSTNDIAVLEISDNSLWAWEIGKIFEGQSSVFRQRLGNYYTPEPRTSGATSGELLSVSFDREENTCNVTATGANSINTNLAPSFCNLIDTRSFIISTQASSSGTSTNSEFFCTVVMFVNSSTE